MKQKKKKKKKINLSHEINFVENYFSLIYLEACLCTTAKRDSLYDEPAISLTRNNERQSLDQYGFSRKGIYSNLKFSSILIFVDIVIHFLKCHFTR